LNNIAPLKEAVIDNSEKYDVENREWDVKVDSRKADALTRNDIKEKNRRNIPYNERNQGMKYQPYLPDDRAITILSQDLHLVPTWHFKYTFKDKNFEKIFLASSGGILRSSFHKDGAICEDCGNSISVDKVYQCPNCHEWLCPSETAVCSSCQRVFHKEHLNKTCPICKQILCEDCVTTCPICNREYGIDHSVHCRDCGVVLCSSCVITSGLILKKRRCPSCEMKARAK